MTENTRFQSKRSRTVLGLIVVAVSIGFAVALAGVSFAQNSSTSAAQYQYGKLTICHHTGSKKKPGVTITISQNAWKAHQKHGDTLGACPAVPPKGKDKSDGTTTTTGDQTNTGDHGKSGDHGHGKGHGK